MSSKLVVGGVLATLCAGIPLACGVTSFVMNKSKNSKQSPGIFDPEYRVPKDFKDVNDSWPIL